MFDNREYTNNHYVPQWYQRRFLDTGQIKGAIQLLDLHPPVFRDSAGHAHEANALRTHPIEKSFKEDDLYTTHRGAQRSTQIEQKFFGNIDGFGKNAVDYFSDFEHPSINFKAARNMVTYMSAQKLRTPKGLGWLSQLAGTNDRNTVLTRMMELRNLYSAVWTGCIWQIADASQSDTKFIFSDHPVTIYNRRLLPGSSANRNYNDPDIRLNASHTIFPLSREKVLILTNKSWAKNPYQDALRLRPNSSFFRDAVFNFLSIQTKRHLSEQEVRQINYIVKKRALRYVGAGNKDWLYPERYINDNEWGQFGNGYLLMPDPRALSGGGQMYFGYSGGRTEAFDADERRPWQEGYDPEGGSDMEQLMRFKAEFAQLHGPYRRGRSFGIGSLDDERDSDTYYHAMIEEGGLRLP
jgi:hypothetical protein